jgi:hypothetical protein
MATGLGGPGSEVGWPDAGNHGPFGKKVLLAVLLGGQG